MVFDHSITDEELIEHAQKVLNINKQEESKTVLHIKKISNKLTVCCKNKNKIEMYEKHYNKKY